jgi:hypothetical protein
MSIGTVLSEGRRRELFRSEDRPLIALWLVAIVSVSRAVSGEDGSDSETSPSEFGVTDTPARRTLHITRVDKGPTVDGDLTDSVWDTAPDGGRLHQVVPTPGGEPSERTEFRVLYDANALYIAVWCYERDTDQIVARAMERDALLEDDKVTFVFDTFRDRRNALLFAVNPNGARMDGLISDNVKLDTNWDGIWSARSKVDEDGWRAEVEIPFKTLSFDPQIDTWGFNVEREMKSRFEIARWTTPRPEIEVENVADAGDLVGLSDLEQGLGLDVVPYSIARAMSDRVTGDDASDVDAGGDLRYRVAPNLTVRLSYNTDFAETDVDARQVTLSRFPIFFPEKREFFLEDSGIFDFGIGRSDFFRPFFSRRIGLDPSGEVVPILSAGKLTGRVDEYSIGVLDAVLDERPGVGFQNAFVGRIKRNIFDQSSVGLLTTYGDPNSDVENSVVGSDYKYRTTTFLDDYVVEANAFGLSSHTEGLGNDAEFAYGASLSAPNDWFDMNLGVVEINDDFNAAMGFVPRTNVRVYSGTWTYSPRPESLPFVRQTFNTYTTEHITSLSNDQESVNQTIYNKTLFESGDQAMIIWRRLFDAPPEDFEISKGVIIPPGDYWWNYWEFRLGAAPKRLLSASTEFTVGEFYDGHQLGNSISANLLPSKYWGLRGTYSIHNVKLSGGAFDTQLATLRLGINFAPDMTWATFVQYDNVSNTYGYNSRFRWELKPGTDVFLVINQNFTDESRLLTTEAASKVVMTIRF